MRILALFALAAAAGAAEDTPQTRYLRWIDGIAQKHLDQRASRIASVRTEADARQRQEFVRATILELIGGLPDYSGPLNARVTGRLDHGSYAVEKIVFESLPRIYVTANLYRPAQSGRHPAVLLPLGHWEQGKPAVQGIAANLALKGFVVLVYDPLGQGERLQSYDPRLNASLAGGSTSQHFMAGAQSLLAGESFARYRIWDARRALDYLVSRPEVDAERIGCTGCSGGGTLTTYIAALDPRIKVAVPSCYMNSFRVLFSGPVGDSEQSLPNFLSAGLDQADYVELFAPKPWLITSTLGDFFTPEGARQVYEEARRFYRIWGAEDKIGWVVGPGGHGTPLEVREAMYAWMIRWLKDGKGDPREQSVETSPDFELLATDTGQVATSLKGRDIYEVIRENLQARRRDSTRAELVKFIRELAAPAGDTALAPRVVSREVEAGLITERIRFESEPGLELEASLLIPRFGGRQPAVLVVETGAPASPLAVRLARRGNVVLALNPRDTPHPSSYPMLGNWLAATRAWLAGRNLPGMRAHDIRRGLDLLAGRPEVDGARLSGAARGVAGIWLLLASAIDPRLRAIWIDQTPASLRSAFDNPLHRNLHEAVIPGFALRWDLADVVLAIAPRRVIWTDPTDWMGAVRPLKGDYRYRPFEAPDEPYVRDLMR